MGEETFSYVSARIEAIQQELEQLKRVLACLAEGRKRKTKLKGLWKGVEVTEEEIEGAKLVTRDEVMRASDEIETMW